MMNKSRFIFALAFMVMINPAAFSQQVHRVSVSARPMGALPLGSSVDTFTFGSGTEVSAAFIPESFKAFGLNLSLAVSLDFPALEQERGTLELREI